MLVLYVIQNLLSFFPRFHQFLSLRLTEQDAVISPLTNFSSLNVYHLFEHIQIFAEHCSNEFYSFKEFVKIAKNLLLLFILFLLVSSFIWCLLFYDLKQCGEWSILISLFACWDFTAVVLFHLFSRRKSPFLVVPYNTSSVSMIIFIALLWTFSSSTISFLRWGRPELHPVFKMRANHGSTQ